MRFLSVQQANTQAEFLHRIACQQLGHIRQATVRARQEGYCRIRGGWWSTQQLLSGQGALLDRAADQFEVADFPEQVLYALAAAAPLLLSKPFPFVGQFNLCDPRFTRPCLAKKRVDVSQGLLSQCHAHAGDHWRTFFSFATQMTWRSPGPDGRPGLRRCRCRAQLEKL